MVLLTYGDQADRLDPVIYWYGSHDPQWNNQIEDDSQSLLMTFHAKIDATLRLM